MLTKDEITVIQACLMGCTNQLSVEMVTSSIASISEKLQKMKEDISTKDMLAVYIFSNKTGTGLGNFYFKSDNGKVSYTDIIAMEKHVKNEKDLQDVKIINLIELEGNYDHET